MRSWHFYYLCIMKSEEKSIQAISVQAHSEAADNRLLRKKLQARDKRVVELEAMVSNLNNQLCEKVDQLNDMMQKLVAFMTGNGEINLSDSLREAVVAGVRAEFEAREQKLKETYASELEKLTSDFNARLAAKQNEINQLKGINDGDNPTTTMQVTQIRISRQTCDVFRRIKKTAKDKLVDLLAHRWQLATVTAWA